MRPIAIQNRKSTSIIAFTRGEIGAIWARKRAWFLVLLAILFASGRAAWADLGDDLFSDEQRLSGFKEHKRENEKFDRDREAGKEARKREEQRWAQDQKKSLPEYKAEKLKQANLVNDTGQEYRTYVFFRYESYLAAERARRAYVQARNLALARKHRMILLTEEEEYDLLGRSKRVDFSHRLLYGGSPPPGYKVGGANVAGSGGGAHGSSDGGFNGGGFNGGFDFSNSFPPPPPPSGFFDGGMPPPPPPPMIDDPIPPPIFDESGGGDVFQ